MVACHLVRWTWLGNGGRYDCDIDVRELVNVEAIGVLKLWDLLAERYLACSC